MDPGTLVIICAVEYSIKLTILAVVLLVRNKRMKERRRVWAMNRTNQQNYQTHAPQPQMSGFTQPHLQNQYGQQASGLQGPTTLGYSPEAPPPYNQGDSSIKTSK